MEYLEKYLHFLKYEKHYSEETINSYEEDLVEYISFFEESRSPFSEPRIF